MYNCSQLAYIAGKIDVFSETISFLILLSGNAEFLFILFPFTKANEVFAYNVQASSSVY